MSVVVGTAGHIDHGKTTLLRALTGIDADRLPEERARGMTIDVGYAHLALPDGSELDFVDVPGHDRLVGNMLVGAGEIDAAMLVVAADDGPRAQTLEHLELLDALGIAVGLAVVTKIDVVAAGRADQVAAEVRALLAATTLRDAPVLSVSATSGEGIEALRASLVAVRDRVEAGSVGEAEAPCRLAIDRVFTVHGRGTVVTGTLRGGSIARGTLLRIVPGGDDRHVRVREVQVHGRAVERAGPGRVALNVAAGGATEHLARGVVLTTDPAVIASDRLLVALEPVGRAGGGRVFGDSALALALPVDRTRVAIHAGTARVAAFVGRSGRDAVALDEGHATAVLRLDRPIAVAPGDRLVVRRESPAGTLAGGRVLDPDPPRGTARRRTTPERLRALANAPAGSASWRRARLDLHGALAGPPPLAAADLAAAIDERLTAEVGWRPGLGLAELVRTGTAELRRRVGSLGATGPGAAGPAERIVAERIAGLVAAGRLARDGDRVRPAGTTAAEASPELISAMDRLVAALATATPPALADAARAAGCPTEGVRRLEEANRIVRVEDDLAWEAGTWRELAARALALAAVRPLTPAALRDATGSSRKYVMAILEELDRRAILRRTPDGHVPGSRAGQLRGTAVEAVAGAPAAEVAPGTTSAAATAEPERVR